MPCVPEQRKGEKIKKRRAHSSALCFKPSLPSQAKSTPALSVALSHSLTQLSRSSLSPSHNSTKTTETTMTREKPAEGKPVGVSLPESERVFCFLMRDAPLVAKASSFSRPPQSSKRFLPDLSPAQEPSRPPPGRRPARRLYQCVWLPWSDPEGQAG